MDSCDSRSRSYNHNIMMDIDLDFISSVYKCVNF